MHIEKGEIYLANLGSKDKLDIGKIRPVLIFQNNMLNKMIEHTAYKDVIIIPLSSQIRENDFTLCIAKRDHLEKESVLLCNAIKMIDATRLLIEKGRLTRLSKKETTRVEQILVSLFDCTV
ncbi:MAG: type II toxin-antitoxin system PemK/MazF family toxin [Campylobacterota bacterium]|nr:type II toxin-antitoxin system PemK/MazF family toxin [Campylobacterota bacterium]